MALLLSHSSNAAAVQGISIRDSSLPIPAGGNGNSTAPSLSADGRYVVFSSSANDLVTNDNGYLSLDVFLYDRASNTTVLVSENLNGTGGGNGHSTYGNVSTNGRYVMLESYASDLVAVDTNQMKDIFVRDLVMQTTALVSVSTNGGPTELGSSDSVMTPDGRYVAFVSDASRLVFGDAPLTPDVFVRDLIANTTVRVSIGVTNNYYTYFMSSPAITPDGRYVVFCSNGGGMATGVPVNPASEVYLRDLMAGTTQWASTNASVLASNILHLNNAPSSHPTISDDGRYVTFKTGWANGTVSPPVPGIAATLILRYDSTTGLTTVVDTNGFPPWAQNDDVFGPEATPDGRFLVYGTRQGDTNSSLIQLWDAQTGTNVIVSADIDGNAASNSISHTPVISPDGRFVAFLSDATNLVGNAISNGFHIYLRDVRLGSTMLVDADTNGIGTTDNEGTAPSLSADGRFVAFSCPDGKLVAQDNNNALDVFVRDMTNGVTERISQRRSDLPPQTGSGVSLLSQMSISGNGQRIAFVSYANNLVPNDTNGSQDVFVRDLLTGSNILVSAGLDGNPAHGGFSGSPVISADGRFVAFVSSATNIVPLYYNPFGSYSQVYRRNLEDGTTEIVSVNPSGTSIGSAGDSFSPAISQDGRYVVFLTRAVNLGGPAGAYRRDINAATNLYLPSSTNNLSPSMSSDGRYVAYSLGTQVRVFDTQNLTNVYETVGPDAVAMALSPTGRELLYQTTTSSFRGFVVADVANRTNLISITTLGGPYRNMEWIRSQSVWSDDGRFFALSASARLVPLDNDFSNDVYLCELPAGAFALVSVNAAHTASADEISDWPVLSGDGRFIVYRSFATNIVSGISNTPNIILYDRLTGSNSLLFAAQPSVGWSSWVSAPGISADGRTVTFQSWSYGLITNDLNRVSDVFVTVVPVATDSDGDGIPDAWTMDYFGHPTGQANDMSRAQDDADGDGATNLQEYIAGTDPTLASSVLRTEIVLVVATNATVLSWPAVAGRTYKVQYKDDLNDPMWLDAPGTVSVLWNQASYNAPAVSARRYYRISVNQ